MAVAIYILKRTLLLVPMKFVPRDSGVYSEFAEDGNYDYLTRLNNFPKLDVGSNEF